MCYWPVMSQTLGNGLNSKQWDVYYAIGPKHATSAGQDDFDAGPVQAWLTQLVKTAQGIKQSASPGGPSRPGRKPPVPPKPSFTPSAKNKLRFTPEVSTEELAKELPFQRRLHWNLGIPPP